MNDFRNNASRAGSARTGVPSDAAATGNLAEAARRANAGSARRRDGAKARGDVSKGRRRSVPAPTDARGSASRSARANSRRGSLMRYASDNRVVRALYTITTGPYRVLFYLGVILVVGLSLYFPLRDLYVAHRTGEILRQQLAIREQYNDGLQADVDKLLSTEGIEDAARENLGLVKPGETAIDVTGLDDGTDSADGSGADGASAEGTGNDADGDGSGDASTADSGDDSSADPPTTSAEAEAAENAVMGDEPWYIQLLDAIFFYQGTSGQKVASSGSASS